MHFPITTATATWLLFQTVQAAPTSTTKSTAKFTSIATQPAAKTTSATTQTGPNSFHLDISYPGSSEVLDKLGPLEYPGARPGAADVPAQVGWPAKPAEELDGFIQDDKFTGILFYSANTALQLYLNATRTTGFWPKYEVVLGDPTAEADQNGVLSTDWTIVESRLIDTSPPSLNLGYADDVDFFACGNSRQRGLYFGGIDPNGPIPRRCAKLVLLAKYDS